MIKKREREREEEEEEEEEEEDILLVMKINWLFPLFKIK